MPTSSSFKRRLVRSCKRILSRCTAWLPASGVRVLGYHSISDGGSSLCVTPKEFESQLRYLSEHGYSTLSIDEFHRRIESGAPSRQEVLITFDDGYVDFLTHAAPLLQRYGCKATVFVVPELVGGHPTWLDRDVALIHKLLDSIGFNGPETKEVLRWNREFASAPLMGWEELKQLSQYGVDVQSHSACHRFLTTLLPDELTEDLRSSRKRIENELRKPCVAIAYPYGDCNADVAQAARTAGYQIGFLSLPAGNSEPLQLGRTQIGGEELLDSFRYSISTAAGWITSLRNAPHQLRVRGRNHGTR